MSDDVINQIAAAMWRADAMRAAPNVGKRRDLAAFEDESDDTKKRWVSLAEAAIENDADELDRLRAENERLVDMLNWAYDTLREINISNYDHDDVCSLNAASVEVILGISAALKADGGKE